MLKAPLSKGGRPMWLTELRESDAALGGWNADATEAERAMGDMADVINLRKMRPGELELRSGFKQWHLDQGAGPGDSQSIDPLWKCEYRLNEKFVDVTFYAQGAQIKALIFDAAQMQASYDLTGKTTTVAACGASPIVCAYQFQTYIVVSLTDATDDTLAGMYALSPTDATLSVWTVIPLGKGVTPTPSGFTFTEKITGKLYAYDVIDQDFENNVFFDPVVPDATNSVCLRTIRTNTLGEKMTNAIDVPCPYFLSKSSGAFDTYQEPLWTVNAKDIHAGAGIKSTLHLKSRGWWYRAVLRKKIMDVRKQTQIISEAPSADFYVEERVYCPPVNVIVKHNGNKEFPVAMLIEQAPDGAFPPDAVNNEALTQVSGTALPSDTDLRALRDMLIAGKLATDQHDNPLYFTCIATGCAGQHPDYLAGFVPSDTQLLNLQMSPAKAEWEPAQPPYKLSVGAHEINGAPNAEYTWADFGLDPTTDLTLYAIDLYRTPYSYPDEKDNVAKSPLWADAYNYGYVGTLHAGDAKFIDNIQDVNLIFSASPLAADGYLEGEFAAEVMRPYQGRLVLGNTRTKYRVRNPWPGIQAFFFPTIDGTGFSAGLISTHAADGLPLAQWYYSYVDRDGNESDAVAITVDPGTDPSAVGNVAFLFPRGYNQDIVSVKLYLTGNLGAGRYLCSVATSVSCATGVYVTHDAVFIGGTAITLAPGDVLSQHTVVNSVDPGAIIWSKSANAWEWPQGNFANLHDQDPITAMDEVIGPLYVASDKGVVMTREQGDQPFAYIEPVVTSAVGTGCISRFGAVKVANRWFFMSAFGLVYVEGSGIVSYPADIETEVRVRLQEIIPGRSMLSGVRNRFSLSFLSNRKEFWGTFPSTVALGGVLPARTFVIKIFEKGANPGMHSAWTTPVRYAYEFDIACLPLNPDIYPDWKDRASPNPQGLVIHLPHADGTMYSAFAIPEQSVFGTEGAGAIAYPARLIVQNNDVEEIPWYGEYALQYQHAMGSPSTAKQLLTIRTDMNAKGQLWLKTGMLRRDGLYDRQNGTINTTSPMRGLVLETGQTLYAWPISGSIEETAGMPVAFRLYGLPDPTSGDNEFWIDAFDLYFGYLHMHMGG